VCFSGKVNDSCGVCNGGDRDKGCDGVCYSRKTIDSCGVCGGNGTSCGACTSEEPEAALVKQAKKVRKTAKVLRDRTQKFADSAKDCSGDDYGDLVIKAKAELEKVEELISTNLTCSILICSTTICSSESTAQLKRTLRRSARKLYKLQLSAKQSAIKDCRIADHGGGEDVKTSVDYYNDMKTAVKELPPEKQSCK